ncbi:MAG: hypothetical protein AUJ51_05850 [Elusimicrobia bacterium CG1_02_56_21]|nr:MAG: hypothetical protein AUJ51_05850 [Elusimicrobia bacterium CG1_02_56_21]
MSTFRTRVISALLLTATAPLRAQSVDCSGTLMSWAVTNPALAANCRCVSESQLPVCYAGGGAGDTSKLGLSGYYDFNRLSPFGAETGSPFFTLRYGDSFRDWHEESIARWRAYLIRNRLAKQGIFVRPDTPAAALIEWLCNVMGGSGKAKERSASLFATLDDSPVDKASSEFEYNYIDPEFFNKDDPAIGPLAGNMAELESNEVDLGGQCAPAASVAPGFRLRYSSMFGGQYETESLRIEQFPDGRVVFTDSGNTRWAFRPYEEGRFRYYRQPAGSPYRLASSKRGWHIETSDGDTIEFSPAPEPDKWRPSRYNSADGSWLGYEYGPNGLARITDMHGRYFAFERDSRGLSLSLTDQNGKRTLFAYDENGRATGVTYPDGRKKTFSYGPGGFLAGVKSGSLAAERYTYDKSGRVLASESEGGVNRLERYYNDAASKTVITDAFGNRTVYSYINEYGRKLTTGVTDAMGGKVSLAYDAIYSIASATDQLGRTTKYIRNVNGDPEAVTDAVGSTSTIQYQVKRKYSDASGEHTDYYSRPVKITDALGRVTGLDYDSYGNLSRAEDALGNKTGMKYDKAGHMLELRDALGSTYKYEYSLGLAKSADPLGRVTLYKRDADLHVTQLTDPLGRNTTFTYDLCGNVTSVTNPANFVTRFAYGGGACPSCGGSQLTALTDPKGNSWTFGYDQYGRLADTANPLGQKKAYQYDKMSRVTEVKDPADNVTAYTYDALNRLTKKGIETPAGEHSATSYVYDKVGNLLSAANAGGMVSFAYDALDRPVKAEQIFGGRSYTITYAYDAVGNRTSMTTPWGKYDYTYDALNRLTTIIDPQNITISFSYDAVGRRTSKKIFKTAPELLAETSYSYDPAGQLLNITNKAGGKVVDFNNYDYDAAGNRTRIEDQVGVWTYGYDASNRLITAIPEPRDMVKAEAFVYDRNGNRRYDKGAWDYKYDAANRLLENSTYTYTHDLNGNLTGRTNKNDNTAIAYTYDPEQQLSEVQTPEHKVQYKYDPLGRRIEKAVDGEVQRYIYDNEDIIAILDGSNTPTETFTHGPGIDEPLIMTRADGTNYFYHADALGSITALTDDNKGTVETYTYKAYGEPTIKNNTGTLLEKSAIGNPYLFTARELDSESGLYFYRARYYDWRRGAFTQEDPIGFNGGDSDLSSYARNSPTRVQ